MKNINRQTFLSLIGFSAVAAACKNFSNAKVVQQTDCNNPLTPSVPEGPYFKDEKLLRVNISEDKKGHPIEYLVKLEDRHCKPVAGAIVNIWHCDADGHYSDFEQEHTLRQTWLRGYQVTDANGECRFESIFPGWYTGRLTHVHAKIQVAGKEAFNTNFFFTRELEEQVYRDPVYTKGNNPATIKTDFELSTDRDATRHDALLMHIRQDNGRLQAHYKVALDV